MEQLPRPWAARRRWQPACGHTQPPGGAGPLSVNLLRGVVPVETDGSANFYVPTDRNIYFQALNKDYLELQRERTYGSKNGLSVSRCCLAVTEDFLAASMSTVPDGSGRRGDTPVNL